MACWRLSTRARADDEELPDTSARPGTDGDRFTRARTARRAANTASGAASLRRFGRMAVIWSGAERRGRREEAPPPSFSGLAAPGRGRRVGRLDPSGRGRVEPRGGRSQVREARQELLVVPVDPV